MPDLVTSQWLADQPADSVVILDASKHLPDAGRDAHAEYDAAHIPGAQFMDLDALTSPALLAEAMGQLGVSAETPLVVYDDSAIRSAARAWFVLRMAGARRVGILDGGLGKWREEGRALASGAEPAPPPATFTLAPSANRLRDKAAVLANITSDAEQLVDARGAPRFAGTMPEPRPGLAAGHIPGARNLPYTALYHPDGTFLAPPEIRAAFAAAGVDLARPLVASCGSGVTACVLAFAAHLLGKEDVVIYEGSWAEWGADPALPKAQGPAA